MQPPIGSTGLPFQEHAKNSALISLQQTALRAYFNIVSDPLCNDGVPIHSFGSDGLNLILSQNGLDTQHQSWGEDSDSLLFIAWRDGAALSHSREVHTLLEFSPDGNRGCARYVLNFLQLKPR